MENAKQWYYSKTVWGALVAIAASALQMKGLRLDASDQSALVDGLASMAGAAGGLLAVYGRLKANTAILVH